MEEHADKVDPTTIEAIELAIAALKDDLETENADKIKSGIQNVTEAAMRLGEAIYKSQAEAGDGGPSEADRGQARTTSSMPISKIWMTTSTSKRG